MCEKRSNHTVYSVNYQFVWCRQPKIDCLQISDLQYPKYRHATLESLTEDSETVVSDVC